jgi:hypothetical protein
VIAGMIAALPVLSFGRGGKIGTRLAAQTDAMKESREPVSRRIRPIPPCPVRYQEAPRGMVIKRSGAIEKIADLDLSFRAEIAPRGRLEILCWGLRAPAKPTPSCTAI